MTSGKSKETLKLKLATTIIIMITLIIIMIIVIIQRVDKLKSKSIKKKIMMPNRALLFCVEVKCL